MKCDDDIKVNTPHTNKTRTVTPIHINVNFKTGTWAESDSQHIYDISAWCGDQLFPLKSSPSRLGSQTHQQVFPLTHFRCAVVLQKWPVVSLCVNVGAVQLNVGAAQFPSSSSDQLIALSAQRQSHL